MKEVGLMYKSSIAFGCLILMLASMACTGWFFYSWLGGIPGLVGASVGCAVQLMAYGFSGIIVQHANGVLRYVLITLIASALSLSVLSSYATLAGYFSALEAEKQAKEFTAEKKEQAIQAALSKRMLLMDSMSRDVNIGSEAANQGLSESYRTQANQFLNTNAATRSEMSAQIDKVEAMIESEILTTHRTTTASPIDGLSSVLGGQNTAIMIICVWLAILFDALPIVGITLLEAKSKKHLNDKDSSEAPTNSEVETLNLENSQDAVAEAVLIESNKSNQMNLKVLTNICASNLQESKAFYVNLLGFNVKYESDWYIQLCSPYDTEIEFGIIQHNHELIPNEYQNTPSGMYLTFVVEDVNHTFARALEMGVDVLQQPRDEFYGQRRILVKDPNQCLVDICSPWETEAA